MFSINLVTLDSYQSTPLLDLDVTFSDFRGNDIRQVPVIRIFGSTPSGLKTCLHIHRVFPYMYIPCTIDNNVDSFMYKLAAAIDSALNVSLGSAMSNTQHVHKIQRVAGIPLYGYHEKQHLFFKIFFYNPAMIKRAADLLQNGTIFNQCLQPHEAHIPFILQFMIDYNLYGMSLINLRDVKFRQSTYTGSKDGSQNESSSNSFDSQKWLPLHIARQSSCKLEVDACASDILNRQELQNGLDLNPGIAAIWNEEKYRREAKDLDNPASQLLYTNSNERSYEPTENDIYQKERLIRRLQSISQISEDITPVSSKTLSYPIEVADEDNLLNREDQNESLLDNNLLELEKTVTPENSIHDTANESTILDSQDMQLVEMLAGLAEESEEERVIDNDSMLGSQFSVLSNQIQEDHEDDELDDLNITSLELDSLSSWNSAIGPISQTSMPEIDPQVAENDKEIDRTITEDSLSLDVPQLDGIDDLILKNEEQSLIFNRNKTRRKKKVHKSILNDKTMVTTPLNIFDIRLSKYLKLDHENLDVYDIDEIDYTSDDYKALEPSICSRTNSSRINLNKLNIPAFDGNGDDSSSDSELVQDITISREEKRICVYKSSTSGENNVVNGSSKRKIELNDSHLESPRKRRNINACASQNESHCTPRKKKVGSPRSASKNYSPLNIKIISPKINRNVENDRPCSSTSTCFTPKLNDQSLRTNLFREKINSNVSEETKACSTRNKVININETFIIEKHNSSTREKLTDLEENLDTLRASPEAESSSRSNKEVRKRLNFVNIDVSDTKPVENNLDERHFGNLVLTEDIVNNFDKEKEKINYEHNLPGTSKDKDDFLYIDNVSDKTSLMNEEIIDEDEEDVCNMTYTQYLNKILPSEPCTSATPLGSIRDSTKNESVTITTKFNPPSRQRILSTMKMYNILESKFNAPFFSNKIDSIKQKEGLNKNNIDEIPSFKCSLDKVTSIKLWRRVKINEFYPSGSSIKSCDIKRVLAGYSSLVIHPLIQPPAVKSVKTWVQAKKYLSKKNNEATAVKGKIDVNHKIEDNIFNETSKDVENTKNHSQSSNSEHSSNKSITSSLQKMLENPLLYKNAETQQHLGISYGQIEFSLSEHSGNVENENLQNARGLTVHQFLTILSVEIHVITRDKLLPDPEHDPIAAIFYAVHNDVPSSSKDEQIEHGIVINSCAKSTKIKNIYSTSTMCPMSYVSSEEDLLKSLVILIKHCDPDILIGWEIESLSWGYIFHRASRIGLNNFTWQISRISNVVSTSKEQTSDKDNFVDAKVPGRIILDVWRIMRHEVTLLNYTFENVMYNVMRERISCPTFEVLSAWSKHNNITMQWRVINHYVIRVVGTLRILIHLDVIGRTCEHARLFGIQFYEVFSRGSQFRVESMMLRLAKPLNYIPVSPSIQQRARMRAPESLPLIMEPQSVFYNDPLIVLDFQSLYPSIIIAYNYCFSTCLGRVEHIGHYEPYDFGATTLKIRKNTAQKLLEKINFAPCGVAFVKPDVRMGILPRMLSEILNTRLMVKASMKIHGNANHVLQRVLHSQQLGLKLIANVTYGYTAANFSGRMPCIEVGDSVVSKGRETLERAIKIVESTPKWGAEVVYGDTDSLFILLRGKSRKDAFTIGAEIADTVTAANPPPVKLKFEKVLQPSILQTKKRYCGYMYESPEQEEPEYLAKGIETVRRDGCPAAAKILEKTLKILFDTKDLSFVKLYVTRQFDKILRQKISIQDLTFAKEFRGLRGYKPNACVPALELTKRLMRKDPRAIPRTGERVRYVIIAGAPNQALIHCVRTPMEVISDEGLSPNSIYYITKVIIPPLNRCLNLIGVDANTWYRDMTRRQTPDKVVNLCKDNQKLTIRQFFSTVVCAVCGDQTQKDICNNCVAKPSQTITILQEKMRWLKRTHQELTMICQSCTGYTDEPKCESLDCPVLYRLMQARRDLVQIPYLNDIICNGDSCIERRTMGQLF
ncbi:DNA polymerase zeta catalytic subunit [Ceratina calcarata]|uniref:DNA polymerase n=1 Tax=Ceratina calcarata TaxID=156304 RepID=A0AAJ7IUP7_9HYME|nr:DNA polymerase zeta catalytic subunit [Ceratina calcarata]